MSFKKECTRDKQITKSWSLVYGSQVLLLTNQRKCLSTFTHLCLNNNKISTSDHCGNFSTWFSGFFFELLPMTFRQILSCHDSLVAFSPTSPLPPLFLFSISLYMGFSSPCAFSLSLTLFKWQPPNYHYDMQSQMAFSAKCKDFKRCILMGGVFSDIIMEVKHCFVFFPQLSKDWWRGWWWLGHITDCTNHHRWVRVDNNHHTHHQGKAIRGILRRGWYIANGLFWIVSLVLVTLQIETQTVPME